MNTVAAAPHATTSLATKFHAAYAALSAARPDTVCALGELYDRDVHFEDPIQTLEGRDELLAMNRRLLARCRELTFEMLRTIGDDAEFSITWRMMVTPKLGPKVAVDGISHVRSRDGKVVYHRDFWDLASFFMSAIPHGQDALRLVLKPIA